MNEGERSMRKEIITFSKEEIDEMKKAYNVTNEYDALETWVFHNYDIKHTNGMDYVIGRKRVTIIEYDI